MMSSIRGRLGGNTKPQEQAGIYPESAGTHRDLEASASPVHEALFHQWNDAHTQNYIDAHPLAQKAGASLSSYTLFRATRQRPADILKPGGKLESRTTSTNPTNPRASYSLSKHQAGLPSKYVSMTTSLPAAIELARAFKATHIVITNPQPHGRSLNDHAYSSETAPWPGSGNALADAVPFPSTEEIMRQHEVAVPGSISTESVRGLLPVNQDTGKPDYSGSKKNEHYKSPRDYLRETEESSSATGLSKTSSSESLSSQTLLDTGALNPLKRF